MNERLVDCEVELPRQRSVSAPAPRPAPSLPPQWKLATLAGRFVEVSAEAAGAGLTMAMRVVLEAQRQDEPVAWIGGNASSFFPPDVADLGIDLAALPVIRTPDLMGTARAADHLLRSGSFGLVVLDLGARDSLPLAVQTRLAGLARKSATALLCLTDKDDLRPSLGSLISLRAHARRLARTGSPGPLDEDQRYRCELVVLKDKRRGPGWRHTEVGHGPDGVH